MSWGGKTRNTQQCFHGFALLGRSDGAFRAVGARIISVLLWFTLILSILSKYNISIMAKLVSIFLLTWSREKREEFSSHTSNKLDIEAYTRVDLDSKWVWGGIEEKTQDMSKKSSTPSFQNGCNYGIRVSRNSLILTKLTVNSTLCIPNCKSFWPL
jgi:hypothetical protein